MVLTSWSESFQCGVCQTGLLCSSVFPHTRKDPPQRVLLWGIVRLRILLITTESAFRIITSSWTKFSVVLPVLCLENLLGVTHFSHLVHSQISHSHILSTVKYPTLFHQEITVTHHAVGQVLSFLGRYQTQVCLMVLWQETLVRGLSGLLGAIFLVHWLQIKKDSWVLMSSDKLKLYRRLHCWFHIVTTQPFSITLTKYPFSIIYAHTCWIHYINSNWCNSHKCFSFAHQNSWAHQKYGLELICMDECFLWCPNYGLQNVQLKVVKRCQFRGLMYECEVLGQIRSLLHSIHTHVWTRKHSEK